jgi:hypothetical protein
MLVDFYHGAYVVEEDEEESHSPRLLALIRRRRMTEAAMWSPISCEPV